jgi:hypothetical protein
MIDSLYIAAVVGISLWTAALAWNSYSRSAPSGEAASHIGPCCVSSTTDEKSSVRWTRSVGVVLPYVYTTPVLLMMITWGYPWYRFFGVWLIAVLCLQIYSRRPAMTVVVLRARRRSATERLGKLAE